MPVVINEIATEVHAFDASALATDEVIAALMPRILAELRRIEAEKGARARDAAIVDVPRTRR